MGELRIKEELEDEDELEDDDLDDDDDFSDDSSTSKRRGTKRKLNMNPIDMESQEKIKLERISQLESKVKDLKGENSELANVVKKLKESVYVLKQEVIEHVHNGCQINMINDEVTFSTAS